MFKLHMHKMSKKLIDQHYWWDEERERKSLVLFCFFFQSLESKEQPLIRVFSILFLFRFPPPSSKRCFKGLPVILFSVLNSNQIMAQN